mmetsp:Transcript_117275/g.233747  ORF Transcript_117275/g.233747 Transcript_117275/m.233747 type:complete len:81 (-) Transcript_117275:176-418(-)
MLWSRLPEPSPVCLSPFQERECMDVVLSDGYALNCVSRGLLARQPHEVSTRLPMPRPARMRCTCFEKSSVRRLNAYIVRL